MTTYFICQYNSLQNFDRFKMSDSGAFDSGQAQVIEWNMLDPYKFFPLSLACSVTVRGFLYPLTVVKTRLQIQKRHVVYKGTFDALRDIAWKVKSIFTAITMQFR